MEIKFKDGNNEITILKNTYVGLIVGKEGSGKTQLTESIVVAFLGGNSDYFKVDNIPLGTKCLRIDTEQPQDLIDNSNERLKKLVGSLENYEVLALTDIKTPKQRWDKIKEKLEEDSKIGIIILDNLSGLCTSVNNDQEAVAIATFLTNIATDRNTIPIVLSHAAADGTPLGHVGKSVARTATSFSTFLTYDSKDGITYCSIGKTRLDKIPPFTFTINQETKQVVKGVYTPFPIA